MMTVDLAIAVACVITAYLLGSIPTGYLAGKWLKGIDIREFGSGSTGATNVLRTLGKTTGAIVLFLDALKGAAGIFLIKSLYIFGDLLSVNLPSDWQAWLIFAVAIAAVLGHSKSIFLGFSGGKSVATGLGLLLVMSPMVALGAIAAFALSMFLSKIVSLSSITGAIAVMILMVLLQQPLPYILFGAIAGIYVIIRHRSNIQRIMAGTEPKIGQKVEQV